MEFHVRKTLKDENEKLLRDLKKREGNTQIALGGVYVLLCYY